MERRDVLKGIAGAAAVGCADTSRNPRESAVIDPILSTSPLGFPWRTPDPFLFCVHHDDRYPKGNERLGPAAPLDGRDLGQDFAGKDGWRMYHGTVVPGFPQHPHRGFETVTVVRRGLLDHSDSVGATARYGEGDVQWLTAGKGILHAEMFPLLHQDKENPVELFQIWLNLPRADKLVEPRFEMLWDKTIPRQRFVDPSGGTTEVTVIAGALGEAKAPPPPPSSWASRADADVAIWTLRLSPGARWTLPPAKAGSHRTLYFFRGSGLKAAGRPIPPSRAMELRAEASVPLENVGDEAELLLLQGRPIGEPVVQHGPFVMTSREEIHQTFLDYQRTGFGGWPWGSDDPVHPREEGRFARRPDGKVERPG
jgi:redox-sensitive bicupin YhaK (pirin superfamily)